MNSSNVSFAARKLAITIVAVTFLNALVCFAETQITVETCGAGGPQTLAQIRDKDTDLKVVGICYVNGTLDLNPKRTRLLYVFRNVNIVSGGQLIFQEGKPIDFYAESILVEFKGALTAVSSNAISGYLVVKLDFE